MVVVPVEARALQIVVERGRAEVADLHVRGVAAFAVWLERLARLAIGQECDIKSKSFRARDGRRADGRGMRCDQDFSLARQQDVGGLEMSRNSRELSLFRFRPCYVEEDRRARLAQI